MVNKSGDWDNQGDMSSEQMKAMITCIGDGVIATDLCGKITYMNPFALKITGWSIPEILGKSFEEIFPLIDRHTLEPLESPIKLTIEAGKSIGLQNHSSIFTKDRLIKYVSASCSPIIQEHLIIGVVIVFRDITKFKEMEEALRVERNNLKEIFESTPVGKLIIDSEYTIKQINRTYLQDLNVEETEAVGRKYGEGIRCQNSYECGCGNGLDCIECNIRSNAKKVLQTGDSIIGFCARSNINRNGKQLSIWQKIDFVPIIHNNESCVLVINEDVTKQKENEIKLLKTNDYLHSILDGIPALAWRENVNKQCVYVNKAWCNFTGGTLEESLNNGWKKFMHPHDRELFNSNYESCVEKRIPFDIEYRIKRSDGEYRTVIDIGKPYFDYDGIYGGYIGVLHDITDRKKHVEILTKANNFYLRMFENFPAYIWKTDLYGKISYMSNKWKDITGNVLDRIFEFDWYTYLHSDDKEKFAKLNHEAYASCKPYDVEVRVQVSDGEYRWIKVMNQPFYNMEHQFDGYIGMALDIHDRKVAEEELKRYELLVQNTRDIILFIDESGKIIDANEAALKTYGYTHEELLNLNIATIRRTWDFTKKQMEIAKVSGIFFEANHYRKDGTFFPVEVSSQGTQIGGKQILISIIRDISERKEAEKSIRESEEKFRTLFHKATDAIYLHQLVEESDVITRIVEVNNVACKTLGYSREELIGESILKINSADSRLKKHAIISQVIEKGTCTYEAIHLTKEGKELTVEVNSHYFVSENKKLVLSISRDITERKQTEVLLKESQTRYHSLFMNMHSGFAYHKAILDEDGNVCDLEYIIINDAYNEMFNSNNLIIEGKLYTEVFPKDKEVFVKYRDTYDKVIKKGESVYLDEVYIEHLSKWYSMALYSPEEGYIALVIADIDEKKKAEIRLKKARDQAENANKAKSEFLANMSHEIRTPINGVVGMIDLTLLSELNDEQKDNLVTAKTCAKSLLNVINDILDFSKMEAGKLNVQNINFNIKKLLDEITKTHTLRAEEKGLELLYAFSSNIPPYLVGDPNRIHQILNNLINNAIKFTEEGEVNVEVRKKLTSANTIELQFSVKDTGIGISFENMDLLFKSFSQIDGSNTRKYGGTGLGLVITKQLVELMGGHIWVESEPGSGSIFSFTIPFQIGYKPEEKVIVASSYEGTTEKYDILLVEDDHVNQLVLSKLLNEKGHKVAIASNGLEAVEAIDRSDFDCILMDIQMPVMDGVEATKQIREKEKQRNKNSTVIIALTAYALLGDRERFLSLGLDEYVTKPIQVEELLLVINKAINKNKSGKNLEVDVIITDSGVKYSGINELPKFVANEGIIEQLSSRLKELELEIQSCRYLKIESHANSIKYHFNQIDAEELKNTAFRIELSARRGNQDEIMKYYVQLQREFEIFRKSIL